MQLRDMIDTLNQCYRVAIRDDDNNHVCTAWSVSKGVVPYLDKEVIMWFPDCTPVNQCDFTVILKEL